MFSPPTLPQKGSRPISCLLIPQTMSLSQPHSWRALEISADRLLATDGLNMLVFLGESLNPVVMAAPTDLT